ncbi:Metallo-dependent phosphatase-like protein [Scheffersomyces coipomensis]|uniref:Metallo-dependent phosphatase-like protein n=1 Tax=Scheffersomyces coipomensis TaxID=1788519 RepID=UPI00315CADDB
MSSKDPLLSKKHRNKRKYSTDDVETGEVGSYEDEDDGEYGTLFKIIPYLSTFLIGMGTLYFFTVFLPEYFIPESTDLVGIPHISELDVILKPITSTRALDLKSGKNVDLDENENDDDDDGDDDTPSKAVERLILIGDIHGHYTQFRKLLSTINYNKKNDHLIVLGDFITKGSDSFKVLEYLIANEIDCILGNHEYYVLQNYATFHRLEEPHFTGNRTQFSIKEDFNSDADYLLAKKLEPHHVQYINQCSVIKKLGDVPVHKPKNNGSPYSAPGIAVHAGIRWDLPLDEQDPIDNLEMRSLLGPYFNETTPDPEEEDAISWSKIYNLKQKEKDDNDEPTMVVYYGHDARRGLNLKQYTKGLDSGCDKGDQLSAILIWKEIHTSKKGKKHILFKEEAVSVNC